jgi:hypothetical protein
MSATLICTEADAMRGAAIGAAEKPQTGAYRESMAKDCAGAIGTIERERSRAAVGREGREEGPCVDEELAMQDPNYLPVKRNRGEPGHGGAVSLGGLVHTLKFKFKFCCF